MERDEFDAQEIRCPKLGHGVAFSYCRREGGKLPCARSLVCWEPRFPAREYFRRILTEEEWGKCFEQPPKPKMVSLLELIERAKRGADTPAE